MDVKAWKEKIRQIAKQCGFAAVAFTDAQPIKGLADYLQSRRQAGLHTPFEEKDVSLSGDPQRVWPFCRTVAVLAYSLPLASPAMEGEGKIARSGVGEDYHRVLKGCLQRLINALSAEGWPSQQFHFQVDTGPLNERALAYKAGLGWLGKNQQLIVPGVGSFVSIALLLLDQELPADPPTDLSCGSCRRCIEACPLQLLGQKDFAANRCLSYVTQSKEPLPEDLVQALGLRIFGCDTCQEACPHNEGHLSLEMNHQGHSLGVELWETLNLSNRRFAEQFKPTAAGWRGKGILQRNAFLALKKTEAAGLNEWIQEREKADGLPPLIKPYCD